MNKEQSIHARMSAIKADLSKCKIPKSGKNKFSGFVYHELVDFMPFINDLNHKHGVNASPKFLKKQGICVLTLVNIDNSADKYEIIMPYVEAEMLAKGGAASQVDAIQRLGSTITYNRRYLFMAAYDITESDGIDADSGDTTPQPTPTPTTQPKKAIKDFEAMKKAVSEDPKLLTTIVAQYELSAIQLDDLQTLIAK